MNALRALHDSTPFAVSELAKAIRAAVGDDDQAFLDTLDGQVDAIDAARAVVRYIAECEANAQAMGALADTYKARAKVHADRVPAAKEALLRFLVTIEENTLRLPEATLSVRAGRPKVVGDGDPANLPAALVIPTTTYKPNLEAIRTCLEGGFAVEGYRLTNGAPTLAVRRA